MNAPIFYRERNAMARMGHAHVLVHWRVRELWHNHVADFAVTHRWLGAPARALWRAYRSTWH